MAVMVNITMHRQTPSGIDCKSSRPIVIYGSSVSRETLDKLEAALCEARQLYSNEAFVKSQSTIIAEVCNGQFGKAGWSCVVQGGEIEF